MLEGSVTVNAAGAVERLTGSKRRYSMSNRGVEPVTSKPKAPLPSVPSICDGSHFEKSTPKTGSRLGVAVQALESEQSRRSSCCNSRCNEKWDAEAFGRTRNQLERYGKGTQKVRKVFVRDSMAAGTNHLLLRDGENVLTVCWRFYSALMGVSFNLIRAAGKPGVVNT